MSARTLPRRFYDRDALAVAPELLHKVLVHDDPERGRLAARLVEVEAYCGRDDPGSHAYRGETPRNASMFGRPGHLYVYFTYGMHWCSNLVCGPGRQPHAVLLRGAEPLDGLATMYERRVKARRDRDLCSGPGKLAQAFGFDKRHDGVDVTRGSIRVIDDGTAPPSRPLVSRRIGIAPGRGDESLWRFSVPGSPFVSVPPR
ncbi:MAG TPA: DNA-3-methyladenine glycosylase [Acidimicrobiia bacterium]|nr:DNA-3-methyladenine glycosylase [Acidimicrobiia bacterium]